MTLRKQNNQSIDLSGKSYVPLPYGRASRLVESQLETSAYNVPGKTADEFEKSSGFDQVFFSNNAIWEQVKHRTLRYNSYIKLENFCLFEWIPRSPGLYFTDEAKRARKDALDYIERIENDLIIYNPYGKVSMLEGGIGNFRLTPIELYGDETFFVSASSNGICHQGFPVAIPSTLYNEYLDQIIERGSVYCSLVGKLRFIPKEYASLYQGNSDADKFYLYIEEIQSSTNPYYFYGEFDLAVSIAVSFFGEFSDRREVLASYVTFDPSSKKSFDESVSWMEDSYIKKSYKGTVLTDFDQQRSHFPEAVFSLEKVMSNSVSKIELQGVEEKLDLNINGTRILERQDRIAVIVNKGDVYMEGSSKYNISGGQQGAVGDGASANDFIQVTGKSIQEIDLEALSSELETLRAAARKNATDVEHDLAMGSLAAAEAAAKQGNRSEVVKHLRNAGKWAFDTATAIGVRVAAEAIRASLGM